MTRIEPHAQVTGADRDKLRKEVVAYYKADYSIRAISERTGRSYGAIHRLLKEAGVEFRPRGGARTR